MNDFQQMIEKLCAAQDIHFCIYNYSETIPEDDQSLKMHSHPFCMKIKETLYQYCFNSCKDEMFNHISKTGQPYLKKCHADVLEYVVPLKAGGKIDGVVFLGPFSETADHEVPKLNEDRIDKIKALGDLIFYAYPQHKSSHLLPVVNDLKTAIYQFIQLNYHMPIKLDDLAAYLNLSVSRTITVVRENTGETFIEILLNQRIKRAKYLLQGNTAKINQISKECGFNSTSYFCKKFKETTGLSPKDFRIQNQ